VTISITTHALAWWWLISTVVVLLIGLISKSTSYLLFIILSLLWAIWWGHHGYMAFMVGGLLAAVLYLFMWSDAYSAERKRGQRVGDLYLKHYSPGKKKFIPPIDKEKHNEH
jgi:hypothetical protein